MGGSGKGGSSAPNNNIFGQNPGGGGGGGGGQVNVMRPGGGKPMQSNWSQQDKWQKRVTGEQQPQSQQQGQKRASSGGGKAAGYWSSPEAIAMAKKMAMGAAVGLPFGPGGTAIGTSVAYFREKAKQRGLRENAQHIYAHDEKIMGRDRPGGPLESNTRAMQAGRPGYYRQPSLISGDNSSDDLLGGDQKGGYGDF